MLLFLVIEDRRIKELWACAPERPEKAEWVVASAKVEHKTEAKRARS